MLKPKSIKLKLVYSKSDLQEMLGHPWVGKQILITDDKLPDYNRVFFVAFKQLQSNLFSYSEELNSNVVGYAGESQFKILG